MKKKGSSVQSISFEGPFPENTPFTIDIPRGLKDDTGRRLTNEKKFPLKVMTHSYPPLAKFSWHFGIIEHTDETSLPVTVRNIEETIQAWAYQTGLPEKGATDQSKTGHGKYLNLTQEVKGKVRDLGADNEEVIIEWLKRLRFTDRRKSVFKGTGQEATFTVPIPGPSKEFEVIALRIKVFMLLSLRASSWVNGFSGNPNQSIYPRQHWFLTWLPISNGEGNHL